MSPGKRTNKPASFNKTMDYGVYSDMETKSRLIQKKYKDLKAEKKETQYPTKNFLQNFKGAHHDYLQYTSLRRNFKITQLWRGSKEKIVSAGLSTSSSTTYLNSSMFSKDVCRDFSIDP